MYSFGTPSLSSKAQGSEIHKGQFPKSLFKDLKRELGFQTFTANPRCKCKPCCFSSTTRLAFPPVVTNIPLCWYFTNIFHKALCQMPFISTSAVLLQLMLTHTKLQLLGPRSPINLGCLWNLKSKNSLIFFKNTAVLNQGLGTLARMLLEMHSFPVCLVQAQVPHLL